MRTFAKDSWDDAQYQWETGEFSDEWRDTRHQAAMRGMIYPPVGTKWDSWADDKPSQRAIVIRAIRETPKLLEQTVATSTSWSQVVDKLMRHLNEHRDESERDELYERKRRKETDSYRATLESWKTVFIRMRDSA